MSKDKIILNSNNLIDIYGPKNETINLIKSHFVDLKIIPRGVEVFLEGCDTDIKQAKKIFTELINYAETSNSLMKEDVQKIAKQFGAFFIKDEVNQSAVGYLVTHTGYTYLLDRKGRVRKMFSSKVDVPEMIETVNLLLKP